MSLTFTDLFGHEPVRDGNLISFDLSYFTKLDSPSSCTASQLVATLLDYWVTKSIERNDFENPLAGIAAVEPQPEEIIVVRGDSDNSSTQIEHGFTINCYRLKPADSEFDPDKTI